MDATEDTEKLTLMTFPFQPFEEEGNKNEMRIFHTDRHRPLCRLSSSSWSLSFARLLLLVNWATTIGYGFTHGTHRRKIVVREGNVKAIKIKRRRGRRRNSHSFLLHGKYEFFFVRSCCASAIGKVSELSMRDQNEVLKMIERQRYSQRNSHTPIPTKQRRNRLN